VDVKADLDAGRLDAAASKVGGLTGTIIGGVGASKVLGKGVTGAAGEVVGESAEARALRAAKVADGGMAVDEVFAQRVIQAERVGSALKDDVFHRSASFLSLEQLQGGRVYNLKGGDGVERKLLQVKGGLNGKDGVYEYIIDSPGSVTHQRFIPDGKITGIANQ
jgi:filamentous hemagglutinin